jgi:hypothetical protein
VGGQHIKVPWRTGHDVGSQKDWKCFAGEEGGMPHIALGQPIEPAGWPGKLMEIPLSRTLAGSRQDLGGRSIQVILLEGDII